MDAAVGGRVAGGHDGRRGAVVVECRFKEGLTSAAGAVDVFPGGGRGVGELIGADADYGAVPLVQGVYVRGVVAGEPGDVDVVLERLMGF